MEGVLLRVQDLLGQGLAFRVEGGVGFSSCVYAVFQEVSHALQGAGGPASSQGRRGQVRNAKGPRGQESEAMPPSRRASIHRHGRS